MGPDVIHLRVLRKLADIIARPLSIIFEKSWKLRDIPEDWKKANVTLMYKKDLKEDPENDRPIGLTSIPGEVTEQILLGAITSQMTHMIEKSHFCPLTSSPSQKFRIQTRKVPFLSPLAENDYRWMSAAIHCN
ncbi:rna-directed dna polymerase from mobile element hypothetical protein [Limosa lapponica baueri]|uniref:Rna-directed dna polymerase from mobile element jockey-like n=1 Tax=Limosa lapponica baueri TaxID=1758121 RepID=A0A2I0U141_LIMLA|nr:rna-directed dna polymerase from mobile element hypothetical protein [Limosa lapponica baueri]